MSSKAEPAAPATPAARVVEVIADLGSAAKPRYRYGSGCIVRGRTVITAAHVVAGVGVVMIRTSDLATYTARVDPRFVAGGPGPDMAMVEIEQAGAPGMELPDLPGIPLGIVDRDNPTAEPVEKCHAIGYPWFMERGSPAVVRDTADVYGSIPVLSELKSGLLSLQVSSPPRPLPSQSTMLAASEWSGMSGAPVMSDGCLLGVITEHAPRQGPSSITATPLSFLDADPAHPGWAAGVGNAAQWWERLGVTGAEALRRFPATRSRPRPAYWATLREIQRRTPQLLGRMRELADIASFATGPAGYRWLVGDAWTGKTALLAEAATTALPSEVDVVAYFLSRREADADSSHFLSAVVPQLADLCDADPPDLTLRCFRDLWEQAGDLARANGRRLLLIVDGLDEDLHPPGSISVAGLLPEALGDRTHVLVSSRPYPDLPSDVLPEHPLRRTPCVPLAQSDDARHLADLARQEIDGLLSRRDSSAADVLGLFAAATGPLEISDIAALIRYLPGRDVSWSALVSLITGDAARSLQPIGPAGTRHYMFAHVSLLDYARTDVALQDPDYRRCLDQWAQHWRDSRWPARSAARDPSPSYLLDSYPATLAADPQALAGFVGDVAWINAAIQDVGVDSVLANLRTARDAAAADTAVRELLAVV